MLLLSRAMRKDFIEKGDSKDGRIVQGNILKDVRILKEKSKNGVWSLNC